MRLGRTSEHDNPRGLGVQPVYHPKPLAAFTLESRTENLSGIDAWPGDDGFARKLGDGNEFPIDVYHQGPNHEAARSVVETAQLLG